MTESVTLVVPEDLDGVRADRIVSSLLGLSRREVKSIIDAGGLLKDEAELRGSATLNTGTTITVNIPPEEPVLVATDMPFVVRYEDEDVLVVDKPPGVVVHPGAGTTAPTLVAGLVFRYPELGMLESHRWGLVHRLDRDTSGLIVVGRTAQSHETLQEHLRKRTIKRVYLTLVHGDIEGTTGTIDAPIGRDRSNPTRMALRQDGRVAQTHYRRIAGWEGVTLLEVTLETGRTHQIRVHMASIHHAVVGDRTYGPRKATALGDPGRQWLHACRLEFSHPTTGVSVVVSSPLPSDLVGTFDSLGPPAYGTVPNQTTTPPDHASD